LQVKADELAAEWRRAEQAEAQLADERAAHAVTQAERDALRAQSSELRRFQVAVCAMVDAGATITRSDLVDILKP
jgi:hypothetical protein